MPSFYLLFGTIKTKIEKLVMIKVYRTMSLRHIRKRLLWCSVVVDTVGVVLGVLCGTYFERKGMYRTVF